MHAELQKILDAKIESARRSLQGMGKALLPPSFHEPNYSVVESTGAVGRPWQPEAFWSALQQFTVTMRSIPDVIQTWCGVDYIQRTRPWFIALSPAEQTQRRAFQRQFKQHIQRFRKLPLANVRNITLHSKGIPSIDVIVKGSSVCTKVDLRTRCHSWSQNELGQRRPWDAMASNAISIASDAQTG